MRAVSASAKCAPYRLRRTAGSHCVLPGARCPAQRAGAWRAPRCPQRHLARGRSFSPRRQGPQSCQGALRSHRQCPWQAGRPLPYPAASGGCPPEQTAPQCPAFSAGRSVFEQGIQLLLVSSRAAFRSGTAEVPDFCGFASGWAVPPKRGLPPAPNTPFIRFSQSSVYAMVCPPFCRFLPV